MTYGPVININTNSTPNVETSTTPSVETPNTTQSTDNVLVNTAANSTEKNNEKSEEKSGGMFDFSNFVIKKLNL